ncbi:uncharacterized protein LOC127751637 [Frankliniella occidentalis]|uniref:Uncharacterized protein LOC127751637 n=1 Tax=Frankliniella occidentalis TaxID=133901 RepID=A0A9C6X956_FRAOC|nr:uncharacterized protein LOC127751637 [Frankliniella occidentalis]
MGSEFELTKLRQDELRDMLREFNITMNDEDFRVIFLKASLVSAWRLERPKTPTGAREESKSFCAVQTENTVPETRPETTVQMSSDGHESQRQHHVGRSGVAPHGRAGGEHRRARRPRGRGRRPGPHHRAAHRPHQRPARGHPLPPPKPHHSHHLLARGVPGPLLQLPAGELRVREPRWCRAVLVHGHAALAAGAVQDGVRPTRLTDLVCMPDVNMVCTSSTERELRFYDSRAARWELRVLVSGMDKPVVTMYYHMSEAEHEESTLILGDTGGTLRTFNFNSVMCGPFKQHVGKEVTHVLFKDLCKGGLPGLRVAHFPAVHTNWVRQVYYYASLQSIVSCAACPRPSLFMCDAAGTKNQYNYNIPSGVYCFCASEEE